MEKLTVEIELSKEELEAYKSFVEKSCINTGKYLKWQIMKAVEGHENRISNAKAGRSISAA